ncbi:hypothetical protein LGX06_09825, partial [Streptococcus mutans]|nr:hypothetical protein [Streptococcus mutans]
KVLSAKKSALALYLWEKKKKYRCFFTNTALLRCIFATQKVSTDVFLQKTLLKCKMEARKMNRGCDV